MTTGVLQVAEPIVSWKRRSAVYLWEPFTDESKNVYHIQRNLYKSIYGNKIVFEEINFDLEICFRYGWYNSEKYGWIKKSHIYNTALANHPPGLRYLTGYAIYFPMGSIMPFRPNTATCWMHIRSVNYFRKVNWDFLF